MFLAVLPRSPCPGGLGNSEQTHQDCLVKRCESSVSTFYCFDGRKACKKSQAEIRPGTEEDTVDITIKRPLLQNIFFFEEDDC
jgi:hypothetical protein